MESNVCLLISRLLFFFSLSFFAFFSLHNKYMTVSLYVLRVYELSVCTKPIGEKNIADNYEFRQ